MYIIIIIHGLIRTMKQRSDMSNTFLLTWSCFGVRVPGCSNRVRVCWALFWTCWIVLVARSTSSCQYQGKSGWWNPLSPFLDLAWLCQGDSDVWMTWPCFKCRRKHLIQEIWKAKKEKLYSPLSPLPSLFSPQVHDLARKIHREGLLPSPSSLTRESNCGDGDGGGVWGVGEGCI